MNWKDKKARRNRANISQEQITETIRRKQICNERALKIVEELLEKNIEIPNFLLKLNFINPTYYDDIIEERCIINICGYPLCNEDLTDIPSQKYVISRTSNKVYDISERKKFCTKSCFKASSFIREQILTSPLWLRSDSNLTEFKLLENLKEDKK